MNGAGSKSGAGLRTQLTRRVEPASTDTTGSRSGAGFDRRSWLEGQNPPQRTEPTRKTESASMNEVRFSEQNRIEGQGWLAGNACSANLFHALACQDALAREQETNVLLPCLLPLANAHNRNGVKAGTLKHRLEQNVRTQASGLFRLERELESISLSLHRADEKV